MKYGFSRAASFTPYLFSLHNRHFVNTSCHRNVCKCVLLRPSLNASIHNMITMLIRHCFGVRMFDTVRHLVIQSTIYLMDLSLQHLSPTFQCPFHKVSTLKGPIRNFEYSKCSKLSNTFLFLFSKKRLVFRTGIHLNACQNRKQGRP